MSGVKRKCYTCFYLIEIESSCFTVVNWYYDMVLVPFCRKRRNILCIEIKSKDFLILYKVGNSRYNPVQAKPIKICCPFPYLEWY